MLAAVRARLALARQSPAGRRALHSVRVHAAGRTAERRVPTPLVLLAVPHWDAGWPQRARDAAAALHALPPSELAAHAQRQLELKVPAARSRVVRVPAEAPPHAPPPPPPGAFDAAWAASFARHGFDVVDVELDLALVPRPAPGLRVHEWCAAELQYIVKQLGLPPVLLAAREAACLAAQTYVSSHGVAGLVLVAPPLSLARAEADGLLGDVGGSALDEFDFEPTFPIRVAWEHEVSAADELHWLEEVEQDYLDAGEELKRAHWPNSDKGALRAVYWTEDETSLADPDPGRRKEQKGPTRRQLYERARLATTPEHHEWREARLKAIAKGLKPPVFDPPAWYDPELYVCGSGTRVPLSVPAASLKETFVRSSGPGGQHVNKVSTAVSLLHVPSGERITMEAERSQARNRALALRKMSRHLEELLWLDDSILAKGQESARVKKRMKHKKQVKREREQHAALNAARHAEGLPPIADPHFTALSKLLPPSEDAFDDDNDDDDDDEEDSPWRRTQQRRDAHELREHVRLQRKGDYADFRARRRATKQWRRISANGKAMES